MSENKTQKKKTRRKQNPAKTKTSERKISTPKSDTSNGVIPKNFGDLIKISLFFSSNSTGMDRIDSSDWSVKNFR